MNDTTRKILDAALAADRSIPHSRATAALRLLDGDESTSTPLGRVIHAQEAARLFGVTPKTIRSWAANGALVSVYGAQRKRRCGYTEESVRAMLAGKGLPVIGSPAKNRPGAATLPNGGMDVNTEFQSTPGIILPDAVLDKASVTGNGGVA